MNLFCAYSQNRNLFQQLTQDVAATTAIGKGLFLSRSCSGKWRDGNASWLCGHRGAEGSKNTDILGRSLQALKCSGGLNS